MTPENPPAAEWLLVCSGPVDICDTNAIVMKLIKSFEGEIYILDLDIATLGGEWGFILKRLGLRLWHSAITKNVECAVPDSQCRNSVVRNGALL